MTDLTGGGAEKLPLLLAPAMTRTTLALVLLKNCIEHALPADGPAVHALGSAEAKLARDWPALLSGAVREARAADVVVAGMEWDPSYFAVLAGAFARRPVVAIVHIDLHEIYERFRIPRWRWWLFARCLRACRAVVCISPEAMRSVQRLGVPVQRCRVLPNPVPPGVAGERAQRRAGEPLRLLSVGRLVPQKGFDVLVECAALLADLSFEWTVLGEGPDRAQLEALARDRGVAGRVRFAGFVPDPGAQFAASHAFVLSSRTEGMPLALTEAMRAGLPIVSTRCSTAVTDALGGDPPAALIVEAGSAAALAEGVRSLARDAALATRLGDEARERARRLEPEKVAELWEALLAEVVG